MKSIKPQTSDRYTTIHLQLGNGYKIYIDCSFALRLSVQQGMGMAFQMSNCFIHAFTWLIYKTFLALGIAFSISPEPQLLSLTVQKVEMMCAIEIGSFLW